MRRRYLLESVLVVAIGWASCLGQASPPASLAVPAKEQIETSLKQLEQDSQLDQESKDKARASFESALNDLAKIQTNQERAQEFAQRAANADADLDEAKRNLAWNPRFTARAPAASATLGELEAGETKREANLKDAEQRLAAADKEPTRREERLGKIPDELSETRQQVSKLQEKITALGDDSNPAADANRVAQLVQLQLLESTIALLEKERDLYGATKPLLQAERDVAAANLKAAKEEYDLWSKAANQRRAEEVYERLHEFRALLERKPQLTKLTKEIELIENLLLDWENLVKKMRVISAQLKDRRSATIQLKTEFDDAKTQVAAGGLSHDSGQLLRQRRTELPDTWQYKRNVRSRQDELRTTLFAEYERDGKRRDLSTNLDETAGLLWEQLDEESREGMKADIRDLLDRWVIYLGSFVHDSQEYTKKLRELSRSEEELIDVAEQYSDFIDERVLWIRSAHPLGPVDIRPSYDAARWLMDPQKWQSVGTHLWPDSTRGRVVNGAILFVFCMLAYFQQALRRAITDIGSEVARKGFYRFAPTIRVLLLTLGSTLMWPGVAICVAYSLTYSVGAEFPWTIGMALKFTASVWFALEFVRQLARDEGLAERHLECPQAPLNCMRWALRPMLAIGLPLLFVSLIMHLHTVAPGLLDAESAGPVSDDTGTRVLWSNSLGRTMFIASLAVITFYLHRMFYAKGGVKQLLVSNAPNRFTSRVRSAGVAAAVAMPLFLAALAWVGYYETAQTLALRLFETGCLAVGLILLHFLFVRWVLMRRRRLAIEQFRQRRASAMEASTGEDPTSIAAIQEAAEEIDLSDISHQTVNLLKTTAIVVGFVCAWLIWVDVVPALAILKSFVLWSSGVTEVTLADVLLGAAMLTVTYVAARNVPGLLELTLLNHLPVDAGARFATTTLCRYVIAASGITLAAQAVGITWTSVQWLVAAMGIGLGFGLQEIFANFISGIILLFERPIRVGDIVTLADTTGVVTRIRMRATTITDWDRKEYVVPNKDLVTGRLLNWTLSNQTNRIVITVGIAYGSDPDVACQLLLQIAKNHPLILDDPGPVATFEGFGDSTLNLILRCYLPDLENRLSVVSQLHTEIDRKFREADIEIAFPQRDIHIRTIQQPLKTMTEKTESELPFN